MTLSFLESFSPSTTDESQGPGVVDITLAATRHRKKPSHGSDVRHILQGVLGIAFIFSLLAIDRYNQGEVASLTLYIGSQHRTFTGEVIEGMTVLDALNAASLAGNFKFHFAIEDNKTHILDLAGLSTATIADRYALFLNDQRLNPEEINSVPVKSHDSIVVKVMPTRSQ